MSPLACPPGLAPGARRRQRWRRRSPGRRPHGGSRDSWSQRRRRFPGSWALGHRRGSWVHESGGCRVPHGAHITARSGGVWSTVGTRRRRCWVGHHGSWGKGCRGGRVSHHSRSCWLKNAIRTWSWSCWVRNVACWPCRCRWLCDARELSCRCGCCWFTNAIRTWSWSCWVRNVACWPRRCHWLCDSRELSCRCGCCWFTNAIRTWSWSCWVRNVACWPRRCRWLCDSRELSCRCGCCWFTNAIRTWSWSCWVRNVACWPRRCRWLCDSRKLSCRCGCCWLPNVVTGSWSLRSHRAMRPEVAWCSRSNYGRCGWSAAAVRSEACRGLWHGLRWCWSHWLWHT